MSGSKLASCMGHYSSPREKALKRTNGKNSVQCETEEQLGPPPLRDDTGEDLFVCWLVWFGLVFRASKLASSLEDIKYKMQWMSR